MSDTLKMTAEPSPVRAGMTALLAFGVLLGAMRYVYVNPDRYFLVVAGVFMSSLIYFVVSAIRGGILYDIMKGFLFGAIISVIVEAIPVLDVILTIAFLALGFLALFNTVKNMLVEIILSFGMFFTLSHIHMIGTGEIIAGPHDLECLVSAFSVLALITCVRVGLRASGVQEALLLLSLTFLSIPLVTILLVSLVASARSSSRTTVSTKRVSVKQNVSSHMRAPAFSSTGFKSIYVRDYTRTVTGTVAVAVNGAGPGIIGMGVTGAVSRKLSGKKR